MTQLALFFMSNRHRNSIQARLTLQTDFPGSPAELDSEDTLKFSDRFLIYSELSHENQGATSLNNPQPRLKININFTKSQNKL
jgi:hypothetical protein